ncbi:MAG: DUF2065 domain-containing protein [Gammaproteobacteria bacterium]|nr:DUF2065 domain-containing protein [Gammaproteobacteria bacterium]
MGWHDFWGALALLLVLEGILPFLNPAGLRRVLLAVCDLTDAQLRFAGITSMLLGLVLLYVVRN